MPREHLEKLAERAAEDGEHRVLAAIQAALRESASDEENEEIRGYLRSIQGQ